MSDYLSFNVTLSHQMDVIKNMKMDTDVDAHIRLLKNELEIMCREAGVDEVYLQLIFGIDTMIMQGRADEDILEVLRLDYDSKIAQEYAKWRLDTYALESMFRYGMSLPMMDYGHISANQLQTSKRVEEVISKSPYFRQLSNVTMETLQKKMDEYLYDKLRVNRYDGMGIDGVLAKVLVCQLYLKQHRIHTRVQTHPHAQRLERHYEN